MPLGNIRFRWEGVAGITQYRLEVTEAEPLSPPGSASRFLEGRATQPDATLTSQAQIAGPLTMPGPLVLVALTPADTPVYQAKAQQRQKLQPNRRYTWRVLALDTRGQIIGASSLHQFTYGEAP